MKTSFKKLLAIALVLIMVVSALPVSAMAEYGAEAAKSVPGIMDKVWEGWRDQWLGQLAGRISGRPAQKMQAEAVDGAYVKIDAPNLALPAGTEVRVVKLNDDDMEKVHAIAENTHGGNIEAISAYDITFFCNGKEIEPNGMVSVDMSLLGVEKGKGVSIYHIDSNASDLEVGMTCEKVQNVEINDGVASFKANSFSIYFVSNPTVEGILKVEFYDTNGAFLNAQAVKLSDFDEEGKPIFDPGIRILANYDGTDFSGWAEVESENDVVSEADGMVIEDVNNRVEANFADYLANGVVKFKATNITLGYAKFYALNHDIVALKSIKLDNSTLEGSVNFDVAYYSPIVGYRVKGWVMDDDAIMPAEGAPDDTPPTYVTGCTVYSLEDVETLSFNNEGRMLEFYPYLEGGFWLLFNNNEGYTNAANGFDGSSWNYTEGSEADDVAPVFCAGGNTAGKAPTNPTREGYTFGGWYKDKACTVAFGWGEINEDTTLYAKWTPAKANVNITIWIEKLPETDFDGNFTAAPVYEYYTTLNPVEANTASIYTPTTAAANMLQKANSDSTTSTNIYTKVDEFYFQLDTAKNSDFTAKVRGDGKSVINYYFKRRNITFYIHAYGNTNTFTSISRTAALTGTYKNRALYGKPSGSQYYEALTRVDGKIYLKKGLYMFNENHEMVLNPDRVEYTGNIYIINKSVHTNSLNGWTYTNYYSYTTLLKFEGRYGQWFSYWPDYDLDSTFAFTSRDNNPNSNGYTALVFTRFYDGDGKTTPYRHDLMPFVRTTYNNKSSIVVWTFQDFTDEKVEVARPGYSNQTMEIYRIRPAYEFRYYSYINIDEAQGAINIDEESTFDHLSYSQPYGTGLAGTNTSVVENPVFEEYNGRDWFEYAETYNKCQPNNAYGYYGMFNYLLGDGKEKFNMQIYDVNLRNKHTLHYFANGVEINPFPGTRPQENQGIYHNYSPNIMDYMVDINVRYKNYEAALSANNANFDWSTAGMDEALFYRNAEPQPTYEIANEHFVGWYKDYTLQEPFNFNERMQSDSAAFARFEPDHYRIVLHYDTVKDSGSTFQYIDDSESTTVVRDSGEQIFDNELSWQNGKWTDNDGNEYLFRGWFYDSKFQNPVYREGKVISAFADTSYNTGSGVDACTGRPYVDKEEDFIAGKIDLYALFTKEEYSVSGIQIMYDAVDGDGQFSNGDVIRMDDYIYADGSEALIGSASAADDEEYAFDHWVLLDKDGNPTEYVYYPGDTFTIDMQYAVSGVQITYYYNVGPVGDTKSVQTFTTFGYMPTPPAETMKAYISGNSYYEFDHWSPELAPATEITSYTAVYKDPAPIPDVDVIYHTNLDTDATEIENMQFADELELTDGFEDKFPSVSVPAGKVFIGWSLKQTGATAEDTITELVLDENRDYDIYAVWANKVVFRPGIGDGIEVEDVTFSDNGYVIPEGSFGFTKTNWSFDGWKIDGTGTTTYYAGDTISNPTFPLVLVAQWLEGHNVIYHANNGTDATTSQFVNYGQSFTFKTASELSGFSRTGYYMTGKLYENAECTGTSYNFGDSHASISADLHVYVQWEEEGFEPITPLNSSTTFSNDKIYLIGYVSGDYIYLLSSDSDANDRRVAVKQAYNGIKLITTDSTVIWKLSGSASALNIKSTAVDKWLSYKSQLLGGKAVLSDSSYDWYLSSSKIYVSSSSSYGLKFNPQGDSGYITIAGGLFDSPSEIVILEKNAPSANGNILPAPESTVLDAGTKTEGKVESPVITTSESKKVVGEYLTNVSVAPVAETRIAKETTKVETAKVNTKKPSVETKENGVTGNSEGNMVITFRAVYSPKVSGDCSSRIVFNANGLSFTNIAKDTIENANDDLDWTNGTNSIGDYIASSEVTYYLNRADAEVYIPGPQVFEQYGKTGYRLIGWNTQPDGTGMDILFTGISGTPAYDGTTFDTTGNTVTNDGFLKVYIDNNDKAMNTRINTLYAMWEGYTAFYHSADNSIESNKNGPVQYNGHEVGGTLVYSTYAGVNTMVNIPGLVLEGYLYGGYYKDYTRKGTGYKFADISDVTDAVAYDGTNADWDMDDENIGAYKERGDEFSVAKDKVSDYIGKTIYIKEVPESKYLRTFSLCTYNRNDKVVRSWWLVTDTDDNNYMDTGFIIDGVVTTRKAWPNSVKITPQNSGETGGRIIDKQTFNTSRALVPYVGYLEEDIDPETGELIPGSFDALEGKTYTNYWITPDSILVIGVRQRTFGNDLSSALTAASNVSTSDYTGDRYYYYDD